eukprot:TRINITY_DN26174_c0_g1_i1.p1 TRINITY_DN26174_c0_g1~~TRINITY_DN26174_c0_g1_i1.p1  ORF type:complete len:105 (-),score=3.00 TRINITY_DN26174_c0_g1_i1:288-602(-)
MCIRDRYMGLFVGTIFAASFVWAWSSWDFDSSGYICFITEKTLNSFSLCPGNTLSPLMSVSISKTVKVLSFWMLLLYPKPLNFYSTQRQTTFAYCCSLNAFKNL